VTEILLAVLFWLGKKFPRIGSPRKEYRISGHSPIFDDFDGFIWFGHVSFLIPIKLVVALWKSWQWQ
jgi:hypothetical protein